MSEIFIGTISVGGDNILEHAKLCYLIVNMGCFKEILINGDMTVGVFT
jgi:hypothetical protein